MGLSSFFGTWVAQNSGPIAAAAGLTTSTLHMEESATAFCRSVASGVSHESIGHAAWKRLTLQSTREQFAQCLTDKEIERITDAALEYAIRPADRKRDDKRLWEPSDGEDALQLHRAAASAGYFRPPPQETATGQDRTDLIDEAVEAVTQAPVLLDLAEALREWDVIYGALGMGLPEFLRSRECTLALRKKLKDGCLMELNHGTFVRLPMPEECETGNMAAAMKAGDGRALTAIVVARLVREQARAPVGLMTETIADGYLFIANPEDFVLQAVAALPRQVVKVAKLALDIIASGYLRLERSRVTLVGAAFSPENSRCLDAQIALKSLGHHFGIDEWKERSWQSVKTTAIAATGPARHLTDFEEAIPEDAFKDGGKKEDQKEVIAVASFPKVAGDLKTNEDRCQMLSVWKVDYNDVDLAKRVWVKEPEDEGIRALQSTVQGAVKRLSEDLYSGEAHFLLELLQNVDDCQYPEGEKPTLQLTYESRKDHFADFTSFKTSSRVNGLLVVEHNEAGFQENNVVAICDIDKSTKKAREKRFIGAKGIGFKSVFLVTATPVIHSGRFHFHFDADALNGLGSLLPFPLTPVTPVSRQTGTQLVLPLSSSEGPLKKRGLRASDVATRALQDMRPTLLLFLQKLECVQAIDRNSGRTRTMTKEVLEAEVGGAPCQEIKLKSEELSDVQEVIEERWLVYTKPVQLEGEAITELKLAFRLDKPAGVEQAYAWLPLRSYGLRFLIQADWRVPSSREAITEAVFNQKIRDQVPNAYGEAAKIFAAAALKAAGLEDANAAGTAWSQLEDCIEAARDALVPLYTSIPRQGDATDFFQETDGKILRAVMDDHDDPSPASATSEPLWRCWSCGNDTFAWTGSDPPPLDPLPDTTSQAFDHNRTRVGHASPHEGPFHESREQAESEAPTDDPVVDPEHAGSTTSRSSRRSRKRAHNRAMNIAARQDVGVGNVDTLSNAVHSTLFDGQSQPQQQQSNADLTRQLAQLVRTLQRAVGQGGSGKASKSSEGSSSWNSQKGPERGVRYRSGAPPPPPPPPAWKYAKDDLRSFPKWQRKLEIWKRQITSFMSRKDAALLLYSSPTGEAEEELEHCDLDRLASSEGTEYIEQTLKSGLATRLVYQKRKLMSDYESIVRQPSESVRAFANRYRRAEQALQSVSVDIRGMYDDESRGNRLLERSRLSPENQRLVLIGSAYNLAYEAIVESLCMSFPEHKSPPQLFGKDGFSVRQWSTYAGKGPSLHAGPRKHPPFSQSQMLRPTPPRWLKAWRQVIQTLLSLEWLSLQWMSKMVKLQAGRFTRAWITLQETVAQQEVDKTLARMKRDQVEPDVQEWEASAGWSVSQRSSLPQPSFSSTLHAASSKAKGIKAMAATQSKSKPKSKAKPQAIKETQPAPLPSPMATSSRHPSRPPSSSLGAYAVQASQAAQVVIYSDEEEYMDDSQVNSQDEEWNWEEHQQPIQTQGPIRSVSPDPAWAKHEEDRAQWVGMDNTNYKDRPEELAERRALERPVVEEAMQWCRMQRQAGRYYLIENPQTSRLWDEESVQSMLQDTGGQTVTCHSGAYGAMNSKGNPIRKTFRFASNNKDILTFLQDKLTAEELKLRVPLEGKETTLSQEYPQRLITSILKGVRYVARQHNPTRFNLKKVYATFTQPVLDQKPWQDVIAQARTLFTASSSNNIILEASSGLYKKIQELLPWEITRLQVCLRPLVQRLPQHVPHTHRGHVLKFVGREDLSIMAEDLADIHFPRGRFEAPVELAIFFYGYPSLSDEHLGIPGEEEIFHDEIFFPNTPGIDRTIKASVARMHKNMGHLPPNEMIKLFCLNGITSDQVIKCTKAMTCSACERAKPPKPPNPASSHPQYLGQFADNLQANIFYLRDATSRNHPVLGIICEATHLHTAIRLDSRQPIHLAQAFRNAWVRNFGFPLRLSVDDDGAFKSNFMDYCDEGGVFLDFIPPEAHFKLGTIERHNGALRMLLEKIVDSTPCSTPEDLDNAIVSALYSKNSATWTSGRPPFIAAFGKIPRVGLDFINDPRALIAGSSRSEAQQQAAMMRCEAYKALAEASASSTLRRALLRKTNQQPAEPPEPGSLLAYWRWTVRSHRKRGGYRIARYLGKDPDNSSYWIQSGSQTIKVVPNQVRNVFGYEEYVPTCEDVKALKAAEDNIRSDLWQDHRLPPEAEPPLPDEEPEIPPEDAAAFELADGDFPSVDAPLTTPEALAIQDQRESFDPSQPSAPHPGDGESARDVLMDAQRRCRRALASASGQAAIRCFKADVSARMNAPGSFELYGYQRPPMSYVKWRRTIDANANELIFEGVIDPDEEEENKLHFGEPRNIITEFWFTPPPEANHYYYGYDETIREIEPGWDGSDENYLPPTKRYYQVYVEQLASSVDDLLSRLSDSDTDVDDYKTGKRLTRQEKKQIEKELSFHDILSQSEEYIQKFIESAQKEETSFLEWKSLKPVPPEETKRILSDPEQKKRVISSRACYRDKNKNVPPLKAKTRIVARGNQDPDLKSLARQAPTPTRVSEMMTFLIFLSGLRSKAFRSDKVWKLWAGDASTAFLQGQQDLSERAGKLYLKAPRDPLLIRAGVFKSELYEILGNVYGLSNAPYTWAQEVTKRLVNLGFVVHSFDRMMFWYPDPDNAPCPAAVLICYVDDFLITFNTSFPFQQFVDSFKWGSQQFLEQGSPLVFKRKEIHLEQTGDVQTLRIVQETFITNLEMGQVGKKQNKETTYADLDCLYKTLQHVKDTSKLGIRLYPVPIDESTVVMAYSDASWANAQGSASQHGQIIMLAPATVTEKPCYGGLIDWKSSRSKRVCRSTLAAEAVSADSAADRLAYVQYALGELVFGVAAHRVGPRLRALLATDCKSLYDSVSSPNPTVEDKRSLVNIRSIQEVVSRNTIHWIPTALQMADRYVEVGGMPARAAEGLRVPVLDANIALDCLKAMGRLHTQKVADQGSASLTDGDIEVLQLLLLIVAMAATKKRQLTEDVRNLQIVPTDGGKLVCLTAEEARGFKVYDVPPDMVGIEALLGAAGQRLDPRLSQKARPEVREFLVQLGVEQVDGSAFFTNVLLPVLTQSEASEAEKLILATRQFKDLLGICDQDRKDNDGIAMVGDLTVILGQRETCDTDWLAPSSAYYGEEAAESEASSWEAFWMLLGAAPVFQVEELQEDFRSEELVRLLAASSTPHLAGEVVALLAPHGEYYSQFLWKPGRS
ncbi:Protein NO VEIN (Protein EMBRYO DEFECTIVE 2597) [Durusdinium trenchii]|uniref:Protein NO VEIN (Protein EMBRYO DEFECTIVE 2597) n=1 Tax=Durusdinium trenchii TaxID=1381693 RepID=A0ABP0LYS1_9DINO